MQKTILFSVANSGGIIYKIKAFKELGYRVIAGDANPNAIGKYYADAFYCLPWQSDPNYFDRIFDIIRKEKITVYIPAGEKEALQVSRMRERFLALGCTPTAANEKTLEMAVDKCKLFAFLRANTDIPLPLFHPVENIDDFNEGIDKIGHKPLCMKPAVTSGSRGFVLVGEETPAKKIFNNRLTFLSVTPDYVRESFKENALPKMILMEYLDHTENVNASIIAKDGELIFSSVHTRENIVSGLSTRGTIVENEEIIEINRKIASALNTTGFIVGQFIGNKLIEINPRWSTSIIYKSINEYLMGVQVWTGEDIVIDEDDIEIHSKLTYQRFYETLIYDDAGNKISEE